jgi:uncharacterized protein (TIGR02147 family)
MKTQGQFLQAFYKKFHKNKKSLSQRAFAKFLNLDAARLNDFMSDKRILTIKSAENICQRLELDSATIIAFLKAVAGQRSRKKKKPATLKLSAAQFKKVSDWHYFAILALADTIDFVSEAEWVAERLNISKKQAQEALAVLYRIGFLDLKNGQYILNHVDIETETDIPSEDLRKSHKQSLEQVLANIDKVEVESREIQSVTFAGDPRKLKLAKGLIQQLTQKVMSVLESGRRTEVFEINVQLLPISRRQE